MQFTKPASLLLVAVVGLSAVSAADEYDPLRIPPDVDVQFVDLTVSDTNRDRRIPVRVYLATPASAVPQSPPADRSPLVLFSHGLGGSREGSAYLGRHWAAHGYVSVFLQHPGSDESVWRGRPLSERMTAMRKAASAENYRHRVQDVPAVLDQLTQWNAERGHVLFERLDPDTVGMAGHSFGAQTTQAVAGQSTAFGRTPLTDPRIRAAVIMSPGTPRVGSAERAFGRVTRPWLLMTGTRDTAPIGGQTVESRRAVFPALPAGDKYELVLDGGEHSAFTERRLPGDTGRRNPNHHRVILALSTAFWDTYLRNDPAARGWLTGSGPRSVLQAGDLWQTK